MDMITQTAVAAPQTPAIVGGTNVSSNKAAAQSLVSDGKGSKSFTDVLDKILSPIDKADQPDNTTISIEALLQGLSPDLLMALLTQGQVSEKGNNEVNGLKLDPAAVKALQTLGEQSDALNQLIGSGAFQQWLAKVSDLLFAMNGGNGAKQDAAGGNVASQSLPDQALPKTTVQAHVILTQFITALNQNKDSLLFQQLVDHFQEVVKPAISAQLTASTASDVSKGLFITALNQNKDSLLFQQSTDNFQEVVNPAIAAQLTTSTASDVSKSLKGSMTEVNSKGNASTASLQTALNALLGLTSTPTPSVSKEAGSDSAFKLQIAQVTKQFSKLDALSAKSGLADRMMLAALQSGIGLDDHSTSDVQAPLTAAMQMQDLLRSASTELVKPMQPMTAQSFVQDMSQFVLKTIKVNALNGFSEARLSLSPANLGHVDVKLTMHNGQLVAHFAAQTVLGKEMLEGQLSQLKQSLQGQGLQVERLEVTQNSSLQSSLFQDQRQQQFTQQFARQSKSKYSEGESLPQSFSVEMANMTALRSAHSNGFDVTA